MAFGEGYIASKSTLCVFVMMWEVKLEGKKKESDFVKHQLNLKVQPASFHSVTDHK